MKVIDEQQFEEVVLKNPKIVLVDFYADWCFPCRTLAPILEEVSSELSQEKFEVVKVNVDEAEDLARQFGIMSIPTMIIFKEGKPVERMTGLRPKQQIVEIMEKIG